MDKETKEYLDRKFLGLVTRDDVEKLRQETKANFRQLKEENRVLTEEAKENAEAALDRWKKDWTEALIPLREEFREGLGKLDREGKSALEQSSQITESSLRKIREEMGALLDQMKQEISPALQSMEKGGKDDRLAFQQGVRAEIDELRKGMDRFREQAGEISKELSFLNGTVTDGFAGMKEELDTMKRFSFADLEKKMNALEARIKALEKVVFH
jgi:hypothetical protein